MNKLPREWVAAGEAWERLSKRWGYKGWEKGWGVKGGERVTQGIKRGMREREKRGKWGMDEELKHRVRETQGRDEGKSARGETGKDILNYRCRILSDLRFTFITVFLPTLNTPCISLDKPRASLPTSSLITKEKRVREGWGENKKERRRKIQVWQRIQGLPLSPVSHLTLLAFLS